MMFSKQLTEKEVVKSLKLFLPFLRFQMFWLSQIFATENKSARKECLNQETTRTEPCLQLNAKDSNGWYNSHLNICTVNATIKLGVQAQILVNLLV